LTFLIEVFAASVLAFVTPVTMRTSISIPPLADRVPQPVGLGHVGDHDVVAQQHLRLVGVGQRRRLE